MPIPLTCPDCQAGYEVPDEDAGQLVECACGATLQIPAPDGGQIEVRCLKCGSRYQLPASDAGSRVECACGQQMTVPAASERGADDAALTLPIRCPGCSNRYVVPVSDAGRKVECPCGKSFRIPRDAAARAKQLQRERQRKKSETVSETAGASAEPASAPAAATKGKRKRSKPAAPAPAAPSSGPSAESPVIPAEAVAVEPAAVSITEESEAAPLFQVPESDARPMVRRAAPTSGRKGLWIALGGGGLLLAVIVAVFVFRGGDSSDTAPSNAIASAKDTNTTATGAVPSATDSPATTDSAAAQSGNVAASGAESSTTGTETTDTADPARGGPDTSVAAVEPTTAETTTPAENPADSGSSGPMPPGTETTTDPPATAIASAEPAATAENVSPQPATPKRERPPREKPPKPVTPPEAEELPSIPPEEYVRSFSEGMEAASNLFRTVQLLKREIDESAQPKPEVVTEYYHTVQLAAGAFEATIERVNSVTPPDQVFKAEYLLTYLYQQMRQHWRAGILGGYVARQGDDPEASRESALLALAAWITAWREATDDGSAELNQVVTLGELIESRWPEEERLDFVRASVAEILRDASEPRAAADWFLKVRPDAPEYTMSRVSAGLLLWSLIEEDLRYGDVPDAALVETTRDSLQQGVDRLVAQPLATPDTLFFARLTLAEVLLHQGQPAEALARLTAEPTPVTVLVEPAEGQPRPAEGLASVPVANVVYRALLRGQLGTKQLEPASASMKKLEELAGSDPASLTGLYVQLGQELRSEFESADPVRRPELASAIDKLLQTLVDRTDLPPTLLLWGGETAYRVSELTDTTTPEASAGFGTATKFYERYLAAVEAGQIEKDAQRVLAVQSRLGIALRQSGQPEPAVQQFTTLLKASPNRFALQFEAARTLQTWGAVEGQEARLLDAVNGLPDDSPVWGWGKLGIYLERRLYEDDVKPEDLDKLFDARRQIAMARLEFASRTSDAAAKQRELDFVLLELNSFYTLHPKLKHAGWAELDRLYQQAQAALGQPVKPLIPATVDAQP
jgi:tetratricopeptide (TPR) repeat protein/ribosomal protein S27E